MNLNRMKDQAVDLRFLRDVREASAESRFEAQRFAVRDPEIAAAIDIARRYEYDSGQKLKAYKGGLPQLVNFETCGQGASQASFTTLQAIGLTQQPNINANSTTGGNDGTQFHVKGFGIIGSAAGTATTTFGVDANGTGTAIMISAAQTPATSTVQIWNFDSLISILTAGASGTLQASGVVTGIGATAANNILIPATQPAAPAWNSQNNNFFNLVASWSVSAAGNLYQVNGFWVLQYN